MGATAIVIAAIIIAAPVIILKNATGVASTAFFAADLLPIVKGGASDINSGVGEIVNSIGKALQNAIDSATGVDSGQDPVNLNYNSPNTQDGPIIASNGS